MNFSQWAQKHHRSILFLILVLGIAGLFSSLWMPVGLFPKVIFPRVVVNLDAGDRPAERTVIEVTWPVEEAVRAIPGVNSVRSNTSRGSAEIAINFDWGVDMVSATLQVESAINQVINKLPPNTTFEVRRMEPTVFPILGYSMVSDKHSLIELRDIAQYKLRPILSTLEGVAKVAVLGGDKLEYRIVVDPVRLRSFDMTLEQVAHALSESNVITAVGRLEENYKLYLVLSNTQYKSIDEISQTVLRSGTNGLVRLEDVATISKSVEPRWNRVRADGHRAVLFQIYQQPGGNTVAIAKECAKKLAEFRKMIPADIHIAQWYDQSELIVASAISVRDALLFGVGLAMVVLLLFLRNFKVIFIAGLTVPLVLATTVLVLSELGMSFNIMTLGGMAAAVALIIDDSIVMIEHIIRRLREGSDHYKNRIHRAVMEFTRPLAGSSASSIIIFAPLAFLTGVTGTFFKALSITMAVGLIISFLVAWLATPLLAMHLLRQKDTQQKQSGMIMSGFQRAYGWFMGLMLARPWLIILIIIPLLAVGYYAYKQTGSGFMPSMDEGGFILDYRAPAGTSLSETDRLLCQIEDILQKMPEVRTYSRRTGFSLGGHITEANEGDFFVRLKPLPRRSLDDVMDDVRQRVEHNVPGIEIEMAKLMEDLIGDLTAVPQPIEIKLFSDDGKVLRKLAPEVAQSIKKIPGVVDVTDGIVLAGDAVDIHIDRVKAALEGINPAEVTNALEGYLSGIVTTHIQRNPRVIGLRVWVPIGYRDTITAIENLQIRAADGHLFPLKRVCQVQTVVGQPQITRDDLKRMVAVTGRISGRDMGSTVHDVIKIMNRPGLLPKGVYYTLGGLYEQQQIAFKGLVSVFAAAVALVFVLLLYLYESFRVALAMMFTTLLAMAAVFAGLWLTGTELNITAMMGMTMIIGIVTEVMIFYFSEYNDLQMTDVHQRLIDAGRNRMRPIAMTTFAAIFALMPLALGIGEGSEMLKPLAIAIEAGLLVQLPLVLIVLPVFLSLTKPENVHKKARQTTGMPNGY